jgi:hypothetical protein
MSKVDESFFTAVGCMDGRVQDPVAHYGKQKFGASFPDTITEAGLVGKLSKNLLDEESLRFKIVDVSVGKHSSRGIVLHGHAECAGNPVGDEIHKEDIKKSVEIIKDLVGEEVKVVGVFVKRSESGWEVEELSS